MPSEDQGSVRSREVKSLYDVVIVGAGLAGLTLARQILLYTDKTVLLLDKRIDPPHDAPQKYGESLVQLGGYYLSKVLDLEEYLLINHYLKYNLRFYWPTAALENRGFEDYSQLYARNVSNVPTYQLDRNQLEEYLLRTNQENARCQFLGGVKDLSVDLSETGGPHHIRFEGGEVKCSWVVDASGRGQVLKRQMELTEENAIRHGAIFFWVDGLVNIEKITGRSHQEVLYDRNRKHTGHFPLFLATNHFCAEGQWFWVIPLHGKTSLGLVYDRKVVDESEVSNPKKTIDYVCRNWPMFARDLPQRKILDEGRLIDFSHGCRQTISPQGWAMVGESGRFLDPLYSPGSDLIAVYNTLIVDAIQISDRKILERKCELAEIIERVVYQAFIPSYAVSYDCLGDQEAFTLKYVFELSTYWGIMLPPLLNNLFTNHEFMPAYLYRIRDSVKPVNDTVQHFLSAFFQWKKKRGTPAGGPNFIELFNAAPLSAAEKSAYEVGLNVAEALDLINRQIANLDELARYILTHVYASVLGKPELLTNASFIRSLDLHHDVFDVQAMEAAYQAHAGSTEVYPWKLDPHYLEQFIQMKAAAQVNQ